MINGFKFKNLAKMKYGISIELHEEPPNILGY